MRSPQPAKVKAVAQDLTASIRLSLEAHLDGLSPDPELSPPRVLVSTMEPEAIFPPGSKGLAG